MTFLKFIAFCTLFLDLIFTVTVNGQSVSQSKAHSSSICSRGPPGLPGRDGLHGRDGIRGNPGIPGIPGRAILSGSTTSVGSKGEKGSVGPAGTKGARGEPGTPARGPYGTSGVTYVQWGRKKCSASGVQTLYSGVAAGSHNRSPGGGANTQCLPLDPVWGNYKDGVQGASYISGAEYELWQGIQPFENKRLYNHDVPCAVCYSATKNTQFMLPAKNICPSGWSRAYYGYLMAERHTHAGRNTYLCVDHKAEGTVGGAPNNDQSTFYPVEARCGSLPCPPYVDGRELTCSVCLK